MKKQIKFCMTHRSPWIEDEWYGLGSMRGKCVCKHLSKTHGVCLPTDAIVTWGVTEWKKEGEYQSNMSN